MERTVKCVAIDDEVLALDVIEKFCERLGGVSLLTFTNPAEGMRVINAERPDIVFLDIEMENINGLSIASSLPKGTCFIFTTAYLQYALDGFNLDAVDDLHKPCAYSRFKAAMEKAFRRIEYADTARKGQSLVVKQEYNNVSIPLDDILYIEAMEGYSKIFRVKGTCVVSRGILKNIYGMLPQMDFLRIHRSFIIPVGKVESFNRQEVRLSGGKVLPVGRQYVDAVMAALKPSQPLHDIINRCAVP